MTALSSTQDPTVALIEQRLTALEPELIQMQRQVHALAIMALTPEELQEVFPE